MKKIVSFTAAAAIAAAALTACSPPHENDAPAAERVKTATLVDAPTATATTTTTATAVEADSTSLGTPKYIDCVGKPTDPPTSLSLACADNNDRLENITWTSLDQLNARGTGTRVTNTCEPDCASGEIVRTENVAVVLAQPDVDPQSSQLLFQTVMVDGQVVQP
ncbi:hypothetical protein ACFPVT_00320 [Corynebacterium choanae]|uniref:Secreted protein n=1 Tax=Corynebacterium choanae TaxID=1862358 RepID=A0A3G6J5B3_9CORY|nr:hypothetical protein [Corynebacterium choanae]AZA13156.1 hypothetical protein CCHOA_03735 [Corynebacterium choanae]